MASASPILQHYQLIAALSSKMNALAQAQDWDQVLELGAQYTQAVEALQQFDPLDESDRIARRQLLTQILDDDAHIRHLAAPELERLGHLLGAIKRQHSVLQAYHKSSE